MVVPTSFRGYRTLKSAYGPTNAPKLSRINMMTGASRTKFARPIPSIHSWTLLRADSGEFHCRPIEKRIETPRGTPTETGLSLFRNILKILDFEVITLSKMV